MTSQLTDRYTVDVALDQLIHLCWVQGADRPDSGFEGRVETRMRSVPRRLWGRYPWSGTRER